METEEIKKKDVHIIVEIIDYLPKSIVRKTILKKITGNITATSFDRGEELEEKVYPFDNYIQIIDGTAEVTIDGKIFHLNLGEGIVIPAHTRRSFSARERFKMLSTIIKSGFEDL
jgi:quercetin dioxygenase-like cupin family protein